MTLEAGWFQANHSWLVVWIQRVPTVRVKNACFKASVADWFSWDPSQKQCYYRDSSIYIINKECPLNLNVLKSKEWCTHKIYDQFLNGTKNINCFWNQSFTILRDNFEQSGMYTCSTSHEFRTMKLENRNVTQIHTNPRTLCRNISTKYYCLPMKLVLVIPRSIIHMNVHVGTKLHPGLRYIATSREAGGRWPQPEDSGAISSVHENHPPPA